AIAETLEANRLTEASVRLSVTPGTGARPALPAPGPPTVTVTADPIGARPPARRLRVSTVRLDASRAWRSAKVAQFAPYLLARVEAEEHGYDDALLLNHEGRVVEASTANVFAVLDDPSGRDVLVTPPLEDGPLPGI